MEPIYSAARAIVNRAQSSFDGGLFTFALTHLIHYPETNNLTKVNSLTDHILLTASRSGYSLAIAFGILWIVILIIASCLIIRHRKLLNKRSNTLLYLAANSTSPPSNECSTAPVMTSPKSNFSLTRERLQSHWLCLAVQFLLLATFAILLATSIVLGLVASTQFHANLSSPPIYEESMGRLLSPVELNHIHLMSFHLFPKILRGMAQIRAYFNDFVSNTKKDTEPVVSALIEATERMQAGMTKDFNDLFFTSIGVKEAFELGDLLGSRVISLMKHSLAIVELQNAFKNHFDALKVDFQTWLRLINTYGPAVCSNECASLRATFANNVSIRPDSFMPRFDFAIALKFVTTDQNQTTDTVQNQLNQGRIMAQSQLEATKKIMAERINIPQSIRNMTEKQWTTLAKKLEEVTKTIDTYATYLIRMIAPRVGSISSLFLSLNILFWIFLLIVNVGLAWLIMNYHFVPSEFSTTTQNRIRLASSLTFIYFAMSLLFVSFYFFIGGYLYTEVCRYVDPNQQPINVIEFDATRHEYIPKPMFALDAHINAYFNHNWPSIQSLAKQAALAANEKPMPLPKIQSPIYALAHKCSQNVGILKAMDAIDTFDMSTLNDPQVADRFIDMGKQIMIESLEKLDVNEMFPKETDDQLNMADRLDDFIVDFKQLQSLLPHTYLSIHASVDDSVGNYTLWPVNLLWNTWDAYYDVYIKHTLTSEQTRRLTVATEKVRHSIVHLDSIIANIYANLEQLSHSEKVGPFVGKLKAVLQRLKGLMTNKTVLIDKASQLFDQHIRTETPQKTENLVRQYGPKILIQVGRCERLNLAFEDIHDGTCNGVVSVLNSFWFIMGWAILVGSLSILLSLMFLMHKAPITQTTGRSLVFETLNRKEFKHGRKVSTIIDKSAMPNEIQALNQLPNEL